MKAIFNGIIRPLQKKDIVSVEKIFDLYWNDSFRNKLSDKLLKYVKNDSSLIDQNFKFFVAEENGEIAGVSAIRKLPEHMKKWATTNNPAELYVVAVKTQKKGIGRILTMELIKEAKKEKYTEVILFSGEKHQDSWKFHDKYSDRVAPATAPNGEAGYIWRKVLLSSSCLK